MPQRRSGGRRGSGNEEWAPRVLSVARGLPNGAADRPDAYMYDHDPGRCSALAVIDGRSVSAAGCLRAGVFIAPDDASCRGADTVHRVLSPSPNAVACSVRDLTLYTLRRTLLIRRSSALSNIWRAVTASRLSFSVVSSR